MMTSPTASGSSYTLGNSNLPLGYFPYDKLQTVIPKTTGKAIIQYTGNAPIADRFQYRPEALYANGTNQTVQTYLEKGANALYQQGRGNTSQLASLNAITALQAGRNNQNRLDIQKTLNTLKQAGSGNVNQAIVIKNLTNAIQEGNHTDNTLEVEGTLGSLTMGGQATNNTLNHYGDSTDLLLQYGNNLQNNIVHVGGEQTSNIKQFVSSTKDSNNQATFDTVEEALLEGTGNQHKLTTWGSLGKIALKGEDNQFTINANEGIEKLGATGINQTGSITNKGNKTTPSVAYLNGEASQWQYDGDGQQRLFVGGKNNNVTLVTSTVEPKSGLNQDDKLVLAGKGNYIVADTGAGDDTVQVKLADGEFKAELEGGEGNNTLLLEAGNWRSRKLADGTTIYTRTDASNPNGQPVQTVVAKHFGKVRLIEALSSSSNTTNIDFN